MSSYHIYIDTDAEEFQRGNSGAEIARILRSHANFITREGDRHGRHPLRNSRGATVGQAHCECVACHPPEGWRFFHQPKSPQGVLPHSGGPIVTFGPPNSGYGSDANGGR